MTDVRLVSLDEVDTIAGVVASAFADDPAWSFILGPDAAAARASFARTLLIPRAHRGTAWVAGDGDAVAMWDRRPVDDAPGPGASEEDDDGWSEFRAIAGPEAWERLEVYEAAIATAAPVRPYWYLGVLATRPAVQGRGLATAVLQPGFQAAAQDGWGCVLETSTAVNKAFYAGRGFAEHALVDVPGGPPTWWLHRPPT